MYAGLTPAFLFFALPFCALSRQADDLVARSESAQQALAQGQYARAADLYSGLIRELPPNAGLLLNLGMALHYEGKYTDAVQHLKAALRLKPDLVAADFFLGLSYAKLHQPGLALAPLRAAVAAEPSNKTFQFEFADISLSTGHYEEAAQHFQRGLDLDVSDPQAWQGLGLTYVNLSQQCFERLQAEGPDNTYALLLLANSDLTQGRYRNAYQFYRTALARAVAVPGIHAALAEVYRKTQHPDWAAMEEQRERELPAPDCVANPEACAYVAGHYAEVIASPAKAPAAAYWRARSYEALALAAFDKLRQMPPTPQIHELMADAYRVRGQNHEAAEEFRQALKLDPENARVQALYATALWRDHDYTSARQILEKLVQLDPNSADLKFELGDTLLQEDEPQKAVMVLRDAVRMNPHLLAAHAALAKAYIKIDRPSDAIPHFQAALPADPDASLHFQLAKAYDQTGQAALAKRAREQFSEITRRLSSRQKSDNAEISAP